MGNISIYRLVEWFSSEVSSCGKPLILLTFL